MYQFLLITMLVMARFKVSWALMLRESQKSTYSLYSRRNINKACKILFWSHHDNTIKSIIKCSGNDFFSYNFTLVTHLNSFTLTKEEICVQKGNPEQELLPYIEHYLDVIKS